MQTSSLFNLHEGKSPWVVLLVLSVFVFLSLVIFNLIGLVLVLPFFEFDIEYTIDVVSFPQGYPNSKIPSLIVQGVTAIGAFILVPIAIIKLFTSNRLGNFFSISHTVPASIMITILVVFTFMVVNSVIIQWNMNVDLPDSLSWFENWAKENEERLGEMTVFLTQFDSFWHFLFGALIVAIVPGIGEELLFRGVIQNLFNKAKINPHIAIWLTGFLFAAFHGQFYGVIPRMLLGVLFGYLYYWSGHLGYAMIAHFVNNFFMLSMVYIRDIGLIEYDIESDNQSPDFWVVLLFAVITTALLFSFHRIFQTQKNGRLAKGI